MKVLMRLGVPLFVASLASLGCATPTSSREATLAASVEKLQVEQRAKERRLRDLEARLAAIHAPAATMADVPALPVEVLAPDVPPASEAEIEAEVVDAAAGGGDAAAFEAELPMVEAPQAAVATVSLRPRLAASRRVARRPGGAPAEAAGVVEQYREGVAQLRQGDHAKAIELLRAFLVANPRHDYADNAQYWLGEAYYDQRDYSRAITEFRNTISAYPQGNKVPDAMLKIAYSYLALGEAGKGRTVLNELIALYPRSEPASLASKRLETIK